MQFNEGKLQNRLLRIQRYELGGRRAFLIPTLEFLQKRAIHYREGRSGKEQLGGGAAAISLQTSSLILHLTGPTPRQLLRMEQETLPLSALLAAGLAAQFILRLQRGFLGRLAKF